MTSAEHRDAVLTEFKKALARLRLNDASFFFEPETSAALCAPAKSMHDPGSWLRPYSTSASP